MNTHSKISRIILAYNSFIKNNCKFVRNKLIIYVVVKGTQLIIKMSGQRDSENLQKSEKSIKNHLLFLCSAPSQRVRDLGVLILLCQTTTAATASSATSMAPSPRLYFFPRRGRGQPQTRVPTESSNARCGVDDRRSPPPTLPPRVTDAALSGTVRVRSLRIGRARGHGRGPGTVHDRTAARWYRRRHHRAREEEGNNKIVL